MRAIQNYHRHSSYSNIFTTDSAATNEDYAKRAVELGEKPKNKYNLEGEYGIGYTSQGYPFYFDKEDYYLIKDYCWWKDKKGYICATINGHKNIKMHRLILGCGDNEVVDHIYHRPNDNRKSQIRIATNQQNQRNQKVSKRNKSGKTGVCFFSKSNKWRAYITINNKQKSLGHYNTKEEAIFARKKAEKEYFKEFRYVER